MQHCCWQHEQMACSSDIAAKLSMLTAGLCRPCGAVCIRRMRRRLLLLLLLPQSLQQQRLSRWEQQQYRWFSVVLLSRAGRDASCCNGF
jgi:translation initiation factor RLI1